MLLDRPPARGPGARRWALALRAFGAALILALCIAGLRRFDWRATGAALVAASLPMVGLALLVNFVQVFVKTLRFRLQISPIQRLPFWKLLYYLVVSYGASMLLPGPAGATLRVYVLQRRHGVPIEASLALLFFEKLFEGIGLIFIVAALPFLLPLPRAVSLFIAALSVGGIAVAIAVVLVVRRGQRWGFTGYWSRWARLSAGAEHVRRPSIFAQASALSLAAHLLDCLSIQLLLRAVGLDLPWATGGLVSLSLAFALIVPLTPLNVGALEAGVVGALGLLGAPMERAVAFGLIFHALQITPVLVLGLTGFGLLSESRAEHALDPERPCAPADGA